jgi:hypothetical protein
MEKLLADLPVSSMCETTPGHQQPLVRLEPANYSLEFAHDAGFNSRAG